MTLFDNAVTYIHTILRAHVNEGDVVVDATLGNGLDAATLAEAIGPTGTLYGFDIQQVALDVTRSRLKNVPCVANLHLGGHENMASVVPEEHHGSVRCVTFNLGYLPGGDKTVTTVATTTERALSAALNLLAENGIVTIVCYGHEEGERERLAIESVLSTLDQSRWTCVRSTFLNQKGTPPTAYVVTSRSEKSS